MNSIDEKAMKRRFEVDRIRPLSERLEISPRITERCVVADHLSIRYAVQDTPIFLSIADALMYAYGYVKHWFEYEREVPIDLWVAPDVVDLHYMTCQTHDEAFLCAPGKRDGMNIIVFVSPLSSKKNADSQRLTGNLAHEIAHHFICDISHATNLTMRRKDERDVPMWVEEGLCQVIQSEIQTSLPIKFADEITETEEWYDLEDLWNDLSCCHDVEKAYLQAYKEIRAFLEINGKNQIVHLLRNNRKRGTDWGNLSVIAGR